MIFGHDRWGVLIGNLIVLAIVLTAVFIHGYIKKRRNDKNNKGNDNGSPTVDAER